jgi:hypothetical protein
VSGDATFGNGSEHSAVGGIDDGQALRAFLGDEQARLLSESRWDCKADECRPSGTKKKCKTTSCTTH